MPQHAVLDYLQRIAVALENVIPLNPVSVQKLHASGTSIVPGLSSADNATLKSLKSDITPVRGTERIKANNEYSYFAIIF